MSFVSSPSKLTISNVTASLTISSSLEMELVTASSLRCPTTSSHRSLKKIQEFDRAWHPKFIIVVVNKRVNTRFFTGTGNPQPGTLINQDVVAKHYNFYLLSHAAGRGTATPTHYNVVYDNSELPSNLLENLTYRLCFNYYNWNGAIKVPAPFQNAHKLSYLVGKYTQVDFSEKIAKNYFYL